MKKHKKVNSKTFRWAIYSVSLLLTSLVFALGTPRVVKLAESKILISSNETRNEVLGVVGEKKVRLEIVEKGITPPTFSSQAVLAQDLDSGKILFEKNIHSRLPPASTTKIMTAIVGAEQFRSADILTVFPESLVGGSTMGLKVGERVSFRGLLYGMLLNSGNDAAFTIALNYPGGYNAFINRMNKKGEELGLTDTHFENPAGFDGATHYSSAADLAKIAKVAVDEPQLSRIVATKETYVSSWNDIESASSSADFVVDSKAHHLKNLNKLLTEVGVIGIKTGFTEKAGENFVGLVDRDGRKILTVVLNSSDRFGETKDLINWVYENFSWREVTE